MNHALASLFSPQAPLPPKTPGTQAYAIEEAVNASPEGVNATQVAKMTGIQVERARIWLRQLTLDGRIRCRSATPGLRFKNVFFPLKCGLLDE